MEWLGTKINPEKFDPDMMKKFIDFGKLDKILRLKSNNIKNDFKDSYTNVLKRYNDLHSEISVKCDILLQLVFKIIILNAS